MREVARHDLLTVAPAAWGPLLAQRPDLDGIPHLADWAARGWPVIVRRRVPGEDGALVPAGLPLPPSLGKRRIGLALPPEAVRPRRGVTLAEARATAPAAWHPVLDALLAHGAIHGRAPRVFGGLLWQALTGLSYLSATSDLDLLWPGPVDEAFLDGLAGIAARAPMRLDGEIGLADGFAVNWRELHAAGPGDSVLAKGLERLELRPVPALLTALPPAA
ncbi:phosphoribosyl-dephospho-CoA transferase [Methylobacterium sp. Leaf104]|uniref:malonate decarboxylase holo-[acyl-carrier-protein] synthase n=1 Tax=Methylobacterium TaxID=407 RepID=UPI0006F49AB2|nr:malonate decarboxylase holo-[acyl-carrier-protein] synthase [Methylobacterium sp. Leaf104]KQP39264.1 phosphoribosyl-dephospho-CoA transferase [Methylobacterium sp. Leaf104]MCI9882814.1 malonate decarboxylase holo-[acyl-carrier-protein] synthase [Methylobacterium goesingense]